jgi:hypothetical protein
MAPGHNERELKMKISHRFAVVAIGAFFIASCGGGSSSGSVSLTATDISAGLNVNPNGFSFANFTAAASSEEFVADDLVKMFGLSKDVCVGGTMPCTLVPEAAAFARLVNEARASGHCEGFVVSAGERFNAAAKPSTVTLQNKGDITHGLMRTFATQFLKEVVSDTEKWTAASLKEKVAALEASFFKSEIAYTLGVFSTTGGHAVLPYALEWVNKDVVKIKIYDSNWPGKDRYITVDLKADKWTFAYSGQDPANDPDAWTGGSGDMDMTSMASRTSASCPFCPSKSGVDKTILVVRSADPNWSVQTKNGALGPTSKSRNGGSVSVLPIRAASNESGITSYMITAPSAVKLSFTLPAATRVSGFTSKAAIQIDSAGSETGTVDVTDSNISTDDPTAVLTLADGELVASSNGANNSITTNGDALAVALTTPSGQEVTLDVTSETPAVEIRTGSSASGSDYQVLTQKADNTIEQKSVGTDGKEAVKTVEGNLDNTSSNQALPEALASPEEKPGFIPAADRAFSGAPAPDNATGPNVGTELAPALRPTASVPG